MSHLASKSVLFFLGGAAIGATVALLTAPMSGRETRKKLKEVSGDLADKASRVAPAIRESYRKATSAGKEAFVKAMNGSEVKTQKIGVPLHR